MKRFGRILSRPWFALPVLYGLQLAASLALVIAANAQQLLTKEEASAGFVDVAFFGFRLQHHMYATNFAAYAYLWAVSHIARTLFYGRFAKAAITATLPCAVYLFVRKRFEIAGWVAFAGAAAIGLLPGVICFSWLGVEFGMETPLGFFALWLALFEAPAAMVGSAALAAISAECYGAGLVFLITTGAMLLGKRRLGLTLAAFGVALGVLLAPVVWWKNVQVLFFGGGGRPTLAEAPARLAMLARELFVHGDSYYYFAAPAPAVGIFVGVLAAAGLVIAARKQARSAWPLFVVGGLSLMTYALAGNVIGVRRAIPLVVALGIFAMLAVDVLRARALALAAVVMTVWLAVDVRGFIAQRSGLATSRISLPHDFEFAVAPGSTMAGTVARLLNGSLRLPGDLRGYEPDRTLGILYVLSEPSPLYSREEVIRRCDEHGWSIRSTEPRFARLRSRL